MRARWIPATALVASLCAAPALAADKPHRSIPVGQERKTILVLDQLTRDQARRREQIAMIQAQVETHDRTDRTILLAAAGVTAVVVLYALEKRRRAHRQV
jgi:hypothetical protein